MKVYQRYVCAVLQNPAFIDNVRKRYSVNGESFGMSNLACAIADLEKEMLSFNVGDEAFDILLRLKEKEGK
jgi:hypothetical protein